MEIEGMYLYTVNCMKHSYYKNKTKNIRGNYLLTNLNLKLPKLHLVGEMC